MLIEFLPIKINKANPTLKADLKRLALKKKWSMSFIAQSILAAVIKNKPYAERIIEETAKSLSKKKK